ncbi:MAG: hypothetical protein HOP33_13050 [Verrucomicrobia bacterium]|nr:hypothetical protein [Verrucomicrobiota bacterium]
MFIRELRFFVFLVVLPCQSAVLINESFTYVDGSLVTVSSNAWSTHSGTAGEVEVVSGRVDLRVPASEDVNTLLPGQPYLASASTVLYASFTLNAAVLPTPTGSYFLHFKGSATSNYRAKLFAFSTGAGAGQYRLGLAGSANSPVVTNTVSLNTNWDYRVYIRYTLSNAVATLWVEPDSEDSPSVTVSDASPASSIIALALRQDTGIGVLRIDDLKVGTSFAEVYTGPNIIAPIITQQPVSTSAVEGGAASFVAAATGTGPLGYQWNFNNSPISGATNTTLTLTGLTTNQSGQYSFTATNSAGSTNSASATLAVIQPNASGTLSLVHYNVKGNFASDWSTNAAQVQAIARQLQYLNPDIITLNEIPNGFKYEMTNWMTAFFPTYNLAISPGGDSVLRSGVISRFPITRSQSWLDGASLTNFGYNGIYTRDLFEAEVAVPGATEPLHVFTTHLKSGPDADSQDRRAAECSAISNFFVAVFIPTNGARPYLLTGDMNEDIDIPMNHGNQPIQRITSAPTGLHQTTPLNPFSLNRFTHSIQGSLDARFDYVLPAGVLSSNIVTSQVFRTDLLPSPPSPLQTNDDVIASDHLPVQMIFNYPDPPLRLTVIVTNQTMELNWPTLAGRKFCVESSTNLTTWSVLASNLDSTSNRYIFTTNASGDPKYFRVYRTP